MKKTLLSAASGCLVQEDADFSRLLCLERERRIQAEQQVEAEKQVCLELHQLLMRERRLHRSFPKSPSQATLVPEEDSDGGKEEVCSADTAALPKTCNAATPSSLLCGDFSHLVFSHLPSDLQQVLRTKNQDSRPVFPRALEAVRTDNPKILRECLPSSLLEEGHMTRTAQQQSLLDTASEMGHVGCVRVLMEKGWRPSVCCRDDGMVSVHLAARNGHVDCLQLLLDNGGNPSLQDGDGQTPLFLALCERQRECIAVLIDEGSSLQAVTKSNYSVLHAAVSGNLPDILRLLLVHLHVSMETENIMEIDSIVNHRDKDGNTALHLAASRGYKGCVEVLCACPEVDLNLRDRWNRTALDISTADCKEILASKESKDVVVYVERDTDSHSLHLTDVPLPSSLAVGRITILRHHKWEDIEPLVEEALLQFCVQVSQRKRGEAVDGQEEVLRDDKSGEVFRCRQRGFATARVMREEEEEEEEDGVLRDSACKLQVMDFGGMSSVASFRIGQTVWNPGSLSQKMKTKNLFGVFDEGRTGTLRRSKSPGLLEVFVTLKGLSPDCLGQLALELMIPASTLREYLQMARKERAVMISGPRGCGKTVLAKSIAQCLKSELGARVVHMALHPALTRNDLFRMLHLNGLLVSCDDNTQPETTEPTQPHIIILDDLDRVSAPLLLAELLALLEYRGPDNPLWITAVYDAEGGMLYRDGGYYLREDSYFIATQLSASSSPEVVSQFAHISLSPTTEPCLGLLHRHLMARLIHVSKGERILRCNSLYRVVCWVWEAWLLYNHLVARMDLTELTAGLQHFVKCPVKLRNSNGIYAWLCGVWNQHLAPWIESSLSANKRPTGAHRTNTASSVLTVVVERAFRPTCPLDHEGAIKLFQKFTRGANVHGTVAEKRRGSKKLEQGASPPLRTVSSSSSFSSQGKPPLPPSSSSSSLGPAIVGYEDIARNSKPVKQSKSFNQASSSEPVKLRQSDGKMKTLRKLRSKTLSFFSKENGGSLPRLFRRGSRSSLVSTADEFESEDENTKEGVNRFRPQDLDDFFDMMSIGSPQTALTPELPTQTTPSFEEQLLSRQTDLQMNSSMLSMEDNLDYLVPSRLQASRSDSLHSMPSLASETGGSSSPQPAHLQSEFDYQQKSPSIPTEMQKHQDEHVPDSSSTEPPRRRALTPIQEQTAGSSLRAPHKTSTPVSSGGQNAFPNTSTTTPQTFSSPSSDGSFSGERGSGNTPNDVITHERTVLSPLNGNTTSNPRHQLMSSLDNRNGESHPHTLQSLPKHFAVSARRRRDSLPTLKVGVGSKHNHKHHRSFDHSVSSSAILSRSGGNSPSLHSPCRSPEPSSALSSSLMFSASLGFLSPDFPIVRKGNSRLSHKHSSSSMIEVFAGCDAEM